MPHNAFRAPHRAWRTSRNLWNGKGAAIWIVVLLALSAGSSSAAGEEALGVKVPEDFEVTLFADDDLAHDIYSMTINSRGQVVVSGPGYVRILQDADGDGRADGVKQFADGPASGAQGLYFHGSDLLCIGDGGLLRYADKNGDGRADGPPDLFLKLPTGSEHHSHALRRGPDGWWYLIAGNYANIDAKYVTLETSPVKKPQAGVILRLRPDLTGGEVFADGFRNAYDFDFHPQGDIFTYDSDGERDVSLPWYRPTRVFHVLPASNAGWISRSWKRPESYPDMPPVVAAFGRGSPTGVVCYRHHAFPTLFHNALFVLDWTFGRVLAVPLEQEGGTWRSEPVEFMTGVGQHGFAPTDVAVGPEGDLYVSVGGRGTRGAVYRVRAKSKHAGPAAGDKLAACLDAPQPLASWSRERWLPLAKELGRTAFVDVAVDEAAPASRRVRAIEILTELFDGLPTEALEKVSRSAVPQVRARGAWSLGRTQAANVPRDAILPFLEDEHPLVARFAFEALLGVAAGYDFKALLPVVARQLGSPDRFVRQTVSRVVSRFDLQTYIALSDETTKVGPQAVVAQVLGLVDRGTAVDKNVLPFGALVLAGDYPVELKREAVRSMQLALGDVGPWDKRAAVFDGYAPQFDLAEFERDFDPIRAQLAERYPTGDAELDHELARLLGMLAPLNPTLLDKLLAQITDDSHPVDDIHHLIVAARVPIERNSGQREIIARSLVALEGKLKSRSLPQDLNWEDRMTELYSALVEHDAALPEAITRAPGFGRPGHVMFLSELDEQYLETAVAAFRRAIAADRNYQWTPDVVFVIGEIKTAEHLAMVREQYENFAVRDAVLMVLSQAADDQDRGRFLEGLESSQLDVMDACTSALEELPASNAPEEQFALLKAARRLAGGKPEYALRERLINLLKRNTKQDFPLVAGEAGYRPQPEAMTAWTQWLETSYPDLARTTFGDAGGDLEKLKSLLSQVNWESGDGERGRGIFEKRSCARCHGGARALGPDLSGVARRFSRDDLFTAIVAPDRDVSPRYQTTLVQTTAGKVYTGLIVYESVDGLLMRNSTGQTFRIEADEVEFRRPLNSSLMPAGLLKDLHADDLADLYAYLQQLGRDSKQASASDGDRRE